MTTSSHTVHLKEFSWNRLQEELEKWEKDIRAYEKSISESEESNFENDNIFPFHKAA